METLQERIGRTVGKTLGTHNRLIPLFKMETVRTPAKVLAYIHKAKRRLPAREGGIFETAETVKLIEEFQKALYKEFQRQYKASMAFFSLNNALDELYQYAQKEHPELYEKSKADDIKEINKYFVGWEDSVKPEKMEEVIEYYSEKAGFIGGDKALKDLGIKIAFNLKNERMLDAIATRGVKITGEVTKKTLDDFRGIMAKQYMEVGATPYELRRRIKGLFEDTYKNRAWTIAKTETAVSQSTVQFETYVQNKVTKKQWLAVGDDRTRTSHLEVDQTVVLINEPFENGLMFPHDPTADADEVIACRCDMTAFEVDGQPCTGGEEDGADCNIPWTGGDDIDPTPALNQDMSQLYAKPMNEGGMGMMEMVKMPDSKMRLLERYLEKNQYNKATTLMAKYSGRKASTIQGIKPRNFKRAMRAYRGCI